MPTLTAPFDRISNSLPDLVAFNRRVRERIDPWWEKTWFRRLTWAGVVAFVIGAITFVYFAAGLPSSQTLLSYQPPLPSNVRGYDGNPVQTFARERRVELAFDEYPPLVVQAFTSAEDKTFFTHGGLDYPGLTKAVFNYVLSSVGGGGRVPGGSTITQQVAKYLLQDDEYAVSRKIREMILAFRLEDTLTKEQILELYLNSIFLGRNAYGIQAASRAYFDKDVKDLTLPEAAYLAILPKAPSNYDPVRATRKALERRNYVLNEMMDNGYITEAQRAAATEAPLGTIPYGSNEKFRQMGGYFMEEVRRDLIRRFGEESEDGPNSVYAGGLWVRSSMVPVMQDAAAEALREGLARFDGGRGWKDTGLTVPIDGDWAARLRVAALGTGFPDWKKAVVLEKSSGEATIGFSNGTKGILPASAAQQPKKGGGGSAFSNLRPGMIIIVKQMGTDSYALRSIPEIGGAFLAEEVNTGRVLAMQGGFDVIGSSYNRATQAKRQPGSAFKPIVYVTALENGMTPASIIVDAPFCVWQGAGLGNKCFRNFDGRYAGPKTMRWGVEQSRNLMTVRAASQAGMPKVIANAKKLGVGDYPNYLSIALGAGDTTVLHLVNAYAVLANQGREVRPSIIDFVQDRNGRVIFRTDNRCQVMQNCSAPDWDGKAMPRPPSRQKQLLDPQAAYQMVHVLEGVVERGTATSLRSLERPLFGKTGTTSGPTNVWFIGGTPEVVAGVYLGYDQPRPMGHAAQGGRVAAPVFKQWAEASLKDAPKIPFVAPAGIRMVRIDRVTGKRVFGSFPTTEDPKSSVIWEAFQPETEPRRSFRREERAEADKRTQEASRKPRVARAVNRSPQRVAADDFLQRQGGIY
ncbi:PBP1A family penicillin-binding protein [Sphingomonas sp. HDW15A]|uniref:penicillin-binding protein 1A n=1 Tax=Sphingomonas sp. HDW15A TaxID=2714942 RepID=UPI00140C3182|nr:PBP1A family penicillin-binding protein [Sphingomonas sp. HDW15A]QIK96476.1 PBP1A family penicillin-binding protein [Sphingomonas sp. HDW15A]